jgi:glycosyltransferase involved in cell wall biosynthesis
MVKAIMARIKVVHVVNSDLGLKSHLGNYMRYQVNLGYQVSAVVSPGKWLTEDTMILDDIFVKIIPLRSRISPLEDVNSLAKLIDYFHVKRFDIVHTHSIKPGFLGRLAAKLAGVPIIVHTFHGINLYEEMPARQHLLFKLVETLGCKCGDSILSQSKEDMDLAVREKICSANKLHYLGNGIELERFNPHTIKFSSVNALRSELGILPHQKVIGFIGRSEREKGVCEFIEAANLLKRQGVQAKYLIIGPQQPEKRTAVSSCELLQMCEAKEDLMFLGYRTDVPVLLSLMDIVTLPSYHEGIPRCLMEAAAMGKPVVATRVRGIQETVLDGKTGILVPARSGIELANGISKIINNPEFQEELGRNAREYALTKFDERLFFYRTEIEYRRLIKEKLDIEADLILKACKLVERK